MEPSFRVYFNHRRQYFDVYMEQCSLSTFVRHGGGRWAYWWCPGPRNRRRGWFGDMHFLASRFRPDTVVHEISHMVVDWIREGRAGHINSRNEERTAILMDEVFRAFWREYERMNG